MKVVILAGGLGTRISEESYLKPKPMIEIGEQPILWHIMKEYSHYGFNDFIICLGYKGYKVKEYFNNYYLHTSDVTFDFNKNKMITHCSYSEKWRVTLVDTGLNTKTAGRVKRVKEYIGNEPFLLTYGDGVSDINIKDEIKFHETHQKIVTITTYDASQRFGIVITDKDNNVVDFREKRKGDTSLINAGFMVINPEIFEYLEQKNDDDMLEDVLEEIAKDGEMVSYKHNGFWFCMDTQRDKNKLEEMWNSGKAKWKTWTD